MSNDKTTWSSLIGEDGSEFMGRAGMLQRSVNDTAVDRLDESGTWLLWSANPPELRTKINAIRTEGLIDRFKEITTASDVLRFAKQNGPFQMCHHGLTYFHNSPPVHDIFSMENHEYARIRPNNYPFLQARLVEQQRENETPQVSPVIRADSTRYCLPMIWDAAAEVPIGIANQTSESVFYEPEPLQLGITYGEPIAVWMDLVERVRSVLRIVDALRYEQPGSDEDWHRIAPLIDDGDASLRTRRLRLSVMINEWLRIGDVRPRIIKRREERETIQWHTSLFGILAVQLLGIFRNSRTMAICFECEEIYTPKRAPKVNQRNFCKKRACVSAASKYRKRKSERNRDAQKK